MSRVRVAGARVRVAGARLGLAAVLLAAGLVPSAWAAEPVSPERVALVLEFLEVTEVGGGTANLRDAFVDQVGAGYPQTFEQMLREMSLDDDHQARARAGYDASLDRFLTSFARLFDRQVDLALLARVLYAPIYVRHFSDDDLRELIAFYRTPIGRKSLTALPVAMTEVTLEVVPTLAPIIASLMNEAVAAEKRALRESLD